MNRRAWIRVAACAVVAAFPISCGKRSGESTSVRGQVLYRGDPIAGGTVAFVPDVERGFDGPMATATADPNGSFELVAEDGKPLKPGWYRIAIAAPAGTVSVPTSEQPYTGLPARYRNPALSGLSREIKPGVENVFAFDLGDE